MKPLAIDLYCGLGGWTEGLLAEGWRVVGFDIERHAYGDACYPGELVLQDVVTLAGAQFADAELIVASPPCQAYSYRAMPWGRARALPPPDNTLFEACFRIQREACAAAGRHIPLIVENVRGAQPWVGRSRWNYGSFHLWGDVPALMPIAGQRKRAQATKNAGGSWFNVGHEQASKGQNPDGRKVGAHLHIRDGHEHTRHLTNPAEHGYKQPGISGIRNNGKGDRWWQDGAAQYGSKSLARKEASARIAKIPFPLAQYIARTFHPQQRMVA